MPIITTGSSQIPTPAAPPAAEQSRAEGKPQDAKVAGPKGETRPGEGAVEGQLGKGVSALAMPVTDVVLSDDTRALLSTLLKSAPAMKEKAPTGNSSADGLAAFSSLRELLGTPKAGMADAFMLRTPRADFDAPLSPDAQNTLLQILHEPPADLQTALIEQGHIKAGDEADVGRKYGAMVEKYFSRLSEQPLARALAQQPAFLVQALKQAMPRILEVLRANKAVVLPSSEVTKIEQALEPVHAKASELDKQVAELKKDPAQFAALHTALQQLRLSGHLEGVAPAIAAVAQQIAPVGSRANEGGANAGSAPVSAQTSSPLHIDLNVGELDVNALVFMVMNELAEAADGELMDVTKQMREQLDKKKAQRQVMDHMRHEKARIDGELHTEYDKLQAAGKIDKSVSFEAYKAWRPMERAEDGSARLPPLNEATIPQSMRKPAEGGAGATGPDGAGGAGGPDLHGLDPDYAKKQAQLYGVSLGDIGALFAYWSAHPNLTGVNGKHDQQGFEDWLQGKATLDGKHILGSATGHDLLHGPGLVAGAPKGENGKLVDDFVQQLTKAGAQKDAAKLAEQNKKPETPTLTFTPKPGPLVYGSGPDKPGEGPVTVNRYPSSQEIQGMSSAELRGLYEALVAQFDPSTLPSFDQLLEAIKAYVKSYFDGAADAGPLKHVFEQICKTGDPVLCAIAAEVNKRTLTKVGDDLSHFNLEAVAQYAGVTFTPLSSEEGDDGKNYVRAAVGHCHYRAEDKYMGGYGAGFREQAQGGLFPSGFDYYPAMDALDAKYKNPTGWTPPTEKPPPSAETALAAGWGSSHEAPPGSSGTGTPPLFLGLNLAGALLGGASTEGGSNAEGQSTDNNKQWGKTTAALYDADIEEVQHNLDTMGDFTQQLQTRMQLYSDRRSNVYQALSNFMKKLSQTAETLTGNLK